MSNATKKPVAGRHSASQRETGPNIMQVHSVVLTLLMLLIAILLMHILGGTFSQPESTLIALAMGLLAGHSQRK